MNKILFVLALSFAFVQISQANQVLMHIEAKKFSGMSYLHNTPAKQCFLTKVFEDFDPEYKSVTLYLSGYDVDQADSATLQGPSFALRIDPDKIPLQEGLIQKYNEGELSYEKGILKLNLNKVSAQYYGLSRDIKKIEIATDPELENIKWARAEEYTKRYVMPKVKEQALECEF